MQKYKYKKLLLNDICFFVLMVFSLIFSLVFQNSISRYETKPKKYESVEKIEVVPIVSAKINSSGFVKKEKLEVKNKTKEQNTHKNNKPAAHKKKSIYDYGVDQEIDNLFIEFDDISIDESSESLITSFDEEIAVDKDTSWEETHKDALEDFQDIDVTAPKSRSQYMPKSQLKREIENAKSNDAREEIQLFFNRIKNEIVMKVSMYSDFKGNITINLKLDVGKIISATYSNSDKNFQNKLDELILNYRIKTPYSGIIKQIVVVK